MFKLNFASLSEEGFLQSESMHGGWGVHAKSLMHNSLNTRHFHWMMLSPVISEEWQPMVRTMSYFTPFQSPHAERLSNCGKKRASKNCPLKVVFFAWPCDLAFGGQKYICWIMLSLTIFSLHLWVFFIAFSIPPCRTFVRLFKKRSYSKLSPKGWFCAWQCEA